jgi:uncharacterized protein (TIGR02001 family)
MRKSIIKSAVMGALVAPVIGFAAEAAPAPDYTLAYNVGLFSQYIWRGMTQTHHDAAIQGGVDFTHSSGFYLGAWASNVSWLTDGGSSQLYKNGSLETDWYGGYRYTFDDKSPLPGLGIDLGILQYAYPGHEAVKKNASANTTELYGALSYGWLQGKISTVVSEDAWGTGKQTGTAAGQGENARGTYYAEANLTLPIGDLIGKNAGFLSGVSGIAHIARMEYSGSSHTNVAFSNKDFSYTDYKIGLSKSFSEGAANGVTVGAYWTKANESKSAAWKSLGMASDGMNPGDSTGTIFVQKTF